MKIKKIIPSQSQNKNKTQTNYCALRTKPNACKKNLGIPRIDMPQIKSINDLDNYHSILENTLGLKPVMRRVPLQKPIFASQKEINMSRARDIAKSMNTNSKQIIPVILLRDKKGQYMVVDGHHRWLAHHFLHRRHRNNNNNNTRKLITNLNQNCRQPRPKFATMKSHVTDVDNLVESFRKINEALKSSDHNFHKRHAF